MNLYCFRLGCPINCMTFIDTRGLKTLFATFMNKRKIPKRLGITEESTLGKKHFSQ